MKAFLSNPLYSILIHRALILKSRHSFSVNFMSNTFSCPDPSVISKAGLSHRGVKKIAQIWPVREQLIAWPFDPMDDIDASEIAGAIFHRMTVISVIWDGKPPTMSAPT
jgi:hypothetical protein